jgi:hypothetical protein
MTLPLREVTMPRSYSKNESYFIERTVYSYNPYWGTFEGSETTFLPSASMTEERTFVGSRYPGWKTFRKQNGWLPTLAASDEYVRLEGVPLKQVVYGIVGAPSGNPRTVVKEERYVREYIGITVPPMPPTSMVDEAWSRVRRKVLNQDFNAPVALAEGRKTLTHLTGTATRLYRAMRAFRKGNVREFADNLGITVKKAPSSWLEYKYGWMPLLLDIHGAAKHIAERPFHRDVRVFKSHVSTEGPYNGSNPPVVGSIRHTAMAWVTVRTRSASLEGLNQLGLLNPSLVVWELIPFSFVADWFVNVGDCLAELTAWQGVDILDGGSYSRVEVVGSGSENNYSPYDKPIDFKVSYRKFARSPGVQTMPRLHIKSNPLNLSKLTTSLSLLSGEARKKEWANLELFKSMRLPRGR